MHRFARLLQDLETDTGCDRQAAALRRWWHEANDADAAWALYFLSGGRLRRGVSAATLDQAARRAAEALAGIPAWLFDESLRSVGELAETVALLLPPAQASHQGGSDIDSGRAGVAAWIEQRVLPLRGLPPAQQQERLIDDWRRLDATARRLHTLWAAGRLRVALDAAVLRLSLAQHSGVDLHHITERLVGWADPANLPSARRWRALIAPPATAEADADTDDGCSAAYPFAAVEVRPDAAFAADEREPIRDRWVEWWYDGLRAQLLRRHGRLALWLADGALVTHQFPEITRTGTAGSSLPEGTVLDGLLLAWPTGQSHPGAADGLRRRAGSPAAPRRSSIRLAAPAASFLVLDLLEFEGRDLRRLPLPQRQAQLDALAVRVSGQPGLRFSQPLARAADPAPCRAWLTAARQHGATGLLLRPAWAASGPAMPMADATTQGRPPPPWWVFKPEPFTVLAVLLYTRTGIPQPAARAASAGGTYQFGVWSRPPRDSGEVQAVVDAIDRGEPAPADDRSLRLLPLTWLDAGPDSEARRGLDEVARRTALARFGPVRSLRPTLLAEIRFDAVQASPRHRCGLTLRQPTLWRLRPELALQHADSLDRLQALQVQE